MSIGTPPPFRIGLIGFGNIGTGLVRLLVEHQELMAARLGTSLELAAIADKEFDRPRDVVPPATTRLTTDWRSVATDPEIQAIVELVGVGPDGKPTLAHEIARTALTHGKHFVTANKGLIAPHGGELHALAARHGKLCLYEASVGAGIPLICSLQQALFANRVQSIQGIVNGTCNYILTQAEANPSLVMTEAIAEAQRLGYAEPDPKFDVEGHDSAYKIVILASLAFGERFEFEDVRLRGITRLGPPEFTFAQANGLAIKLLASARRTVGGFSLSVGPTFVPKSHVLAGVRDVFNGVLVHAEPMGDTLYYGRGAGQASTASGLLADLALAARSDANDGSNPYPLSIPDTRGPLSFADPVEKRYARILFADSQSRRQCVLPSHAQLVSEEPLSLSIVTDKMRVSEWDDFLCKVADACSGVSVISEASFIP